MGIGALLPVAFGALLVQAQATPTALPNIVPDPAPAVVEEIDAAEVAIVDGNVVGAKKRALEEAFLRAVERTFAAELADAGVSSAALPDDLNKLKSTFATGARRYVRGYRVVEESEANGKLIVRVVAAVDRVFLRRQIEKSRSNATPATVGGPTPIELVVTEGTADVGQALAGALASAGLWVQVAGPAAPARVGSTRLSMRSSLFPEGLVRGAGVVAARCQLQAVVRLPKAANDLPAPAVLEWGFGVDASSASKACVQRLVPLAAKVLAPVLAGALAPPLRRTVLTTLDVAEPVALERFLRKLPRIATVSRFELRRIAVGVAQVRMETNLSGTALGTALAEGMADQLTVATTQDAADSLGLTVRVRADAEASPTFDEDVAEGQ